MKVLSTAALTVRCNPNALHASHHGSTPNIEVT
jgi:hypothetical protein